MSTGRGPSAPFEGPAGTRLKWAVQALAQPPAVQVTLFPAFVRVPDELVLEFADALQEVLAGAAPAAEADHAPDRLADLKALDRYLDSISGEGHSDLWTEQALFEAPEWTAIRGLAQQAATALGWPIESPGPVDAVYVGPPGDPAG